MRAKFSLVEPRVANAGPSGFDARRPLQTYDVLEAKGRLGGKDGDTGGRDVFDRLREVASLGASTSSEGRYPRRPQGRVCKTRHVGSTPTRPSGGVSLSFPSEAGVGVWHTKASGLTYAEVAQRKSVRLKPGRPLARTQLSASSLARLAQ